MKEGLLWCAREATKDYWDGNNHFKEAFNANINQVNVGKTYWDDGSNTKCNVDENVNVNADTNTNQVKISKTYWNVNDNVNDNVNANADTNANQADNSRPSWDDSVMVPWGSGNVATWNENRNTNWGDDSDSDNVQDTQTTPEAEVDSDCDDESDEGQDPIQLTPEFSSADKIISAIDRNTDVVADLCEIMEGIKGSLDLLHEDNVQNKKVLQKLLTEQRTLNDQQR